MVSLEAADVESDTFDPYDARGGRAARRLPTPARHMQRTARRPAPARVSLMSRSLPEGRSSALASAFAAPEEQVNLVGVGCAYPVRLFLCNYWLSCQICLRRCLRYQLGLDGCGPQ